MAATSLEIDIDCSINNIIERSASAPSSPNERTTSALLRDIGNIGGHVKGRRVTFPDDEMIVTGYFDAPDPWSEDCAMTTDNIVAAYRAACWKQGVKPLQRVLQQLQTAKLNEGLEFELNLKGENLDSHHCEALEEIFKRLQFRCLHLEDCHLDDEGAAALFDMIEYYDSTSHLNISSNKTIGNQGWQACSKMLKRTPCLQYLDASRTSQNEQSLLILGKAFRTGSFLFTLHLEYCGITGRSLVILVAALKLNTTLNELFLGENKMCSADGLQLGNLLRSNSTLELLDLRCNNLQDLGVCHLVDGLCQQVASSGECLKALVLANNNLTHNGMAHINRALLVSESLTTLDISKNAIGDEGIQHLKQGLLTNQSLQHLGLMNTKITCEGAVALAEFVADNQHIAYMDLRENDIRVAGLMALALSLKHNQSMVNLNIDPPVKNDVNSPDGINNQQRLLDEIKEYCARNKSKIEMETYQERHVNFVVQNANVPIIHNETELASLLQEKTAVHRTQSVTNPHPPPLGMVCSASFPAGSKPSPNLPRNRFQVCRVFLDSDKNSVEYSSDDIRGNEDSSAQSEESVFFPSSPDESGYNSSNASPFVKSEEHDIPEVRKSYIRHQDSIAIHMQRRKASDQDEDHEDLHDEDEDEDGAAIEDSSQDEARQSQLLARRSSGGKVVKKLTFVLPEDFNENSRQMRKDRRMSTPALASQKLISHQQSALNMKLGRQLESLDLRSSVPLSPTRLREGLIFPEPLESKVTAIVE